MDSACRPWMSPPTQSNANGASDTGGLVVLPIGAPFGQPGPGPVVMASLIVTLASSASRYVP